MSTSGVAAKNEITIRIHNYAETSLSVVRHAERVTEVILAEAEHAALFGWIARLMKAFSTTRYAIGLTPRQISSLTCFPGRCLIASV